MLELPPWKTPADVQRWYRAASIPVTQFPIGYALHCQYCWAGFETDEGECLTAWLILDAPYTMHDQRESFVASRKSQKAGPGIAGMTELHATPGRYAQPRTSRK